MITLETSDFQQLVALLQGQLLMGTARSRQQAMVLAGLDRLLPLIDVEGPPFVFTSNLIDFLAKYGRLSYDNEALGLFLNAMKPSVGLEQQEAMGRLIAKYGMMVPIAPAPPPAEWKNPATAATVVEKIFGENTLRPVSFLARGLEVSRSVMYVGVGSGGQNWSGTGFLVTPRLGLTNHHVLPAADVLPGTVAKFNYQETFDGHAEPTDVYHAKPAGLFHANPTLDYAVFELEGEPGAKWGHLPLRPRDCRPGERVNIVQHPFGQPKQISIQNNLVEYVGGDVIQYVTSTNPGSSGSPVLNDQWQVVGLHHSGGNLPEPTTGQYYNRNEGILIARILADLPPGIREEIDAAVG